MGSPKRIITAIKPDGTKFSGDYMQWNKITKKSVKAIQKAASQRNRHIKDGVLPYTWEEVVGTHKLKGSTRNLKKKKRAELIEVDRLRRLFMFRDNERVCEALHIVGCMV